MRETCGLAKFCLTIHLILLAFAFASAFAGSGSVDKAIGVGILGRGMATLDKVVSQTYAIEHELSRVRVLPRNDMTLRTCREVVSRSVEQLAYVRGAMAFNMITSDQASLFGMVVTAANTYLRTCRQVLDEAGEDQRWGPFGTVISLLTAAGVDECANSQTIHQAIAEIPKAPTKQDHAINNHPIIQADQLGSILQSIPSSRRVRVAKDGSGNCTTITDAVKSAPLNQNSYFLICIEEGTYEEYVVVSMEHPYLILAGAGEGKTIITGNRSNSTGWGTYYSATLAIEAQNFIGFNLTIENTAGPQNYQAVALRTTGSFSIFHGCTISGYQDTLFVYTGYQFFRQCTITGTIDFIFGDSSVVFQNCTLILRQPLRGQQNVITASDRSGPTDPTGISIHMSSIVAASDLQNTTVSYLGRPWGRYARAAFLLSDFSVQIESSKWYPMYGSPADVEFGEFDNYGLIGGRNRNRNMPGLNWTFDKKLDLNSAYQFTVDRMLLGGAWIGNMTIPYTRGLFQ